jgi:hypothetical protein
MTHARIRLVLACALAIGLVAAMNGPGDAQFLKYDKFPRPLLDPEHWAGFSTEGSFNAPSPELIRVIENGQLHLGLVAYGATSSNSGFVESRVGLAMKQLGTNGGSGFITGVKLNIIVLDAQVEPCASNAAAFVESRWRLNAVLFNDGNGGANNRTGDVFAQLRVLRGADGRNRFVPFLQRCSDATCASATLPGAGNGIPFTTEWAFNTPMVVTVQWDEANGRVTFAVTNETTQAHESRNIVYQGIIPVNGAPSSDSKDLAVATDVANCGSSRKQGMIDVLVDDIKIRRRP